MGNYVIILCSEMDDYKPFFVVNNHFKDNELSIREKEIINFVLLGLSNKEIANKLYISQLTVKTHLQNIYRKLGISNKLQLLNFFKQDRL